MGHLGGDDGAAERVLAEQAGEEPAEDVEAGAVGGQDWVEDGRVCAGPFDPDTALDGRHGSGRHDHLFGFGDDLGDDNGLPHRFDYGRGLGAGGQDQCGDQEDCQE